MNILGISSFVHDSAACLLVDGVVVAAAEEERFNRIKHSNDLPVESIRFCLEKGGITINDIDYVGFYWLPWVGIPERIYYIAQGAARHPLKLFAPRTKKRGGFKTWLDFIRLGSLIRESMGSRNARFKIKYINHHVCHVASTFYSSPFKDAAVLTLDAGGEITSTMLATADDTGIKVLREVPYPHSLGEMYLAICTHLGFDADTGSGKVMGLSSYGDPVYIEAFRKMCELTPGPDIRLDLSYFHHQHSNENLGYYSEKMVKLLGPPRQPGEKITKRHEDIAASVQARVEEVALELARQLKDMTGRENLCISGGVGLNCVMNGLLKKESGFKEVFVPPAPNDSGAAVGAAYYINHCMLGNKKLPRYHSPYLGPEYTDNDYLAAINARGLKYLEVGDQAKAAAEKIALDKIVGWFQGRMEFGPRALGNRSILVSPVRPDMKDILNSKVKFREYFRPFAPVVLREYMKDYFEVDCDVPYMSMAFDFKEDVRDKVPAVVHVDGTGRVQTVERAQNTLYYDVIDNFRKITGIPILLNTSFNIKGEPVVNTPSQAVESFLDSGIDLLFLGRYMLEK